jgi:hypothetical protein
MAHNTAQERPPAVDAPAEGLQRRFSNLGQLEAAARPLLTAQVLL